jgi:cell division septation protein DedD
MRQLLRELAACALLLVVIAAPSAAQPSGVQVTAAAHVLHGDTQRVGGQPLFEPDLGVSWLRPDTKTGIFQMEVRAIRRDGRPDLGRAWVSLRDVAYRGVKYTFEAGDTFFAPSAGDYRLRNLYTPTVNFAGVSVKARTNRWDTGIMVGKATATRNIFGTDTDLLDQSLAIARGAYAVTDRLQVSARLARIKTDDLKEYRFSIADSEQSGGGVKYVLTPMVHLVGDASAVRFTRRGEQQQQSDFSALAGATVLLSRGWVQLNAARFSPGELPILTQPLADRRTTYAAGEYDVLPRARLFGGWEWFETNLYESQTAPAPPSEGNRGFAGVRVPIGSRTSASLRYEAGDRRSRLIGASLARVSDTGAVSAEWQTVIGRFNAFARYAQRKNVESQSQIGSYTQHDGTGVVYMNVTRELQLFGSVMAIHNISQAGTGNTFVQFGGGTQTQLFQRGLWLRAEGLTSRNVDLLSDRQLPQQTVNLGLNGEIVHNTMVGLSVYADRLSFGALGESSWLTRSSLRVTRTFPSAASRSSATMTNVMARHGGTGSVVGLVYSDWNGNGVQDPEDRPLENIPVRLMDLGNATTSRSGEFSFVNVPIGMQQVGIDLTSLPVDFDPPPVPQVQVSLGRGDTKRLAFGLVPLGTVAGMVIRDANNNGAADPADEPVDGAVVVLNGGARSEQVRAGRFRFDAVRSGEHTLELLADSLPPDSMILGEPRLTVTVGRQALRSESAFVVRVASRPEIRRVFGSPQRTAERSPSAAAPATKAAAPPEPAPAAPPSRTPSLSAAELRVEKFAIQVGAFKQRRRALALMRTLTTSGFAAQLVGPPDSDPSVPYRVRVGSYATRADAEQDIAALEKKLGQKVWLVAVNQN